MTVAAKGETGRCRDGCGKGIRSGGLYSGISYGRHNDGVVVKLE